MKAPMSIVAVIFAASVTLALAMSGCASWKQTGTEDFKVNDYVVEVQGVIVSVETDAKNKPLRVATLIPVSSAGWELATYDVESSQTLVVLTLTE